MGAIAWMSGYTLKTSQELPIHLMWQYLQYATGTACICSSRIVITECPSSRHLCSPVHLIALCLSNAGGKVNELCTAYSSTAANVHAAYNLNEGMLALGDLLETQLILPRTSFVPSCGAIMNATALQGAFSVHSGRIPRTFLPFQSST